MDPITIRSPAPGPGELYAPWQITLATFIGGPWMGGFLLGSNYGKLGQPGHRNLCNFFAAWLIPISLGVTWMFLGGSQQIGLVPGAWIYGAYQAAHYYQGDAYARHIEKGGHRAPTLIVVAVSMLSLVAFVATVYGLHTWGGFA